MIISKGKLVASDTPENLEKLLTNQQTVEILAKGNEDTVRKVIGTIGNVQKASVEHGKRRRNGKKRVCSRRMEKISGKQYLWHLHRRAARYLCCITAARRWKMSSWS